MNSQTKTDNEIQVVIGRLRSWARALEAGKLEVLEDVLADDFVATCYDCNPKFFCLALRKADFIELDRHVTNSTIDFKGIWGERLGDMVMTRAIATVTETFTGNLGPHLPTAEEMTKSLSGKTRAFASGWRLYDGIWRCFNHHAFGVVG
ncbi:MAG TPA: hypothetical protein VGI65_21055 [Steroidobacteraceae bacterium]|jgi:hypothetical protein